MVSITERATNILLLFHIFCNFFVALLGVPASVLYIIDFMVDTNSVGGDNIFISIYLPFMTLAQLF